MTRPKYGSDIPKAREELLEVAAVLRNIHGVHSLAREIEDIVRDHLHRTPAVRKVAPVSLPVGASEVAHVRTLLLHTDLTQNAIAEVVGINPGRVSEIAQGLRDHTGAIK